MTKTGKNLLEQLRKNSAARVGNDLGKAANEYLNKAGSYAANLGGQAYNGITDLFKNYYNYRNAREQKRADFRTDVAEGLNKTYQNLPQGVQQGLDKVGGYVKNLIGDYDVTDYLRGVDDTARRMILGPVVTGVDNAYGNLQKLYENGSSSGVVKPAETVAPESTNTQKRISGVQKQMAKTTETPTVTSSEEAGAVTSDSGEEKTSSIKSYTDYVKDLANSVAEKYDADINYADHLKDQAYQRAEDENRIAQREANANFRTGQPTYGAAAEAMLSQGLTGSGYSDYLAGKAYEARTDEIANARSQMSYAKMMADSAYEDNIYQAKTDKYNNETALGELQAQYAKELEDEFNAKLESVIDNIVSGVYNASIGEEILRQYSVNGVISNSVIQTLANAESEFKSQNKNTMISTYLDYITQLGATPTEESMRIWLRNNASNLTDDEINALINGYFTDGKFDTEKAQADINTGNTGSGGSTGNNSTGNTILNDIKDGINNVLGGGTGVTVTEPSEPLNFEDTIESFREAMLNHNIGKGDEYQEILDNYESFARTGLSDEKAVGSIKNMVNGLVVSSGVLDDNKGLQIKYQDGDNFTVKIGGQVYRVESQGAANDAVISAAAGLNDGVMFGYGSELYLKVGDKAVKIGPRPGVGNRDYDKLWKTVYNEALNNISTGSTVTNAGAATERKNELFKKPETNSKLLSYVGNLLGLTNSDAGKGNVTGAYQSALGAEEKGTQPVANWFEGLFKKPEETDNSRSFKSFLANLFGLNKGKEEPEERDIVRGVANYEKDGLFDRKLKKGDNFTVEVANKSYRVESGGEVNDSEVMDAANEAGVYNGEVFMYGDDIYIKRDDKIYSVDSRFFSPNQDDKLAEAIRNNVGAVADENADVKQSAVFLGKDKDFDAMDKIDVTDLDGNKYRLQIRAVLGSDSAAYKAGKSVSDGEAFIHGRDIYVKDGDRVYKLAAVGGSKNGDYDKLAEQLKNDKDPSTGTYKSQNIVAIDKGRIGNAFATHTNYTVDRHGNLDPKSNIKVTVGKNSYWVKTEETTTGGAYRVAKSMDAKPGEIFSWNGNLYIYLGNGAARLGDASLGPGASYLGYSELYDLITNGAEEDLTSYSRYLGGNAT